MNTTILDFGTVSKPTLVSEAAGATGRRYAVSQPESLPPLQFSWQTFLYGKIAEGWRIVQPLPLELEQDEDGTYIYSDEVFAVYGDGFTPEDALTDYVESLIDYYQLLATRSGDLLTSSRFLHLRLYIRPIGN